MPRLDLAATLRLAPPSRSVTAPLKGKALYLLPPLGGSTRNGGWGRRGGTSAKARPCSNFKTGAPQSLCDSSPKRESLVLASPFRGKYPERGMGAPGWDKCQGSTLQQTALSKNSHALRSRADFGIASSKIISPPGACARQKCCFIISLYFNPI